MGEAAKPTEKIGRNETLARSESSVSIEQGAKGARVSVKVYDESPTAALAIALDCYKQAVQQIAELEGAGA